MADIDQMLRESFHRLAEPGDPTGVAEAVRTRVDAGDLGTPSDAGTGFGGGPFTGGGWTWVLGAGAIAGIGGLVLGASGFLGTPSTAQTPPTSLFSVSDTTPGLDCPGGARVASFHPGDRVLAVARSDDGDWLAVRNPVDRADTVWVALDELVLDEGQPEVDSLEVDGCPVFVAAPLPTQEPLEVEETEEPEPETEPDRPSSTPSGGRQDDDEQGAGDQEQGTGGQDDGDQGGDGQGDQDQGGESPSDKIAPVIQELTSSDERVACGPGFGYPEQITIAVRAADNEAVDRVVMTVSNADQAGPDDMGRQGNLWLYVYEPPEGLNHGTVTFTVQAFDAAGNASAEQSVDVPIACLI